MKNKMRVEDGIIVMRVLHKNDKVFDIKCNLADMAILQKYYWVMNKTAVSVVCNYRKNGKMVKPSLHKILTGSPFVKFLNGDKLDFRRDNLQPVEKRISTKRTGLNLKGNPFFIYEEGITFFITDRKGKKTGLTFIVDLEDLDKVARYTWCINPFSGYVQTRTRGGKDGSKGLYLHRLVMDAQKGEQIDHINRQKTDNRKHNLRKCTGSQNCHNMPMHKDNVVGIKGVSKASQSWIAKINIKGKTIMKRFPTFEEAAIQRKAWEKEDGAIGLSKNTNNKSGIIGVSLQAPAWVAQMQIKHETLSKTFPTFAEAVTQRREWESEYNPSGLG